MYNNFMKQSVAVALIFAFLTLSGCATYLESHDRYQESLQDIKEDRIDFAVLSFQAILKDTPRSPYAPSAAFSLGEYYYDHADNFNALTVLSDYIHQYPKHKGVIFAKIIIYKILTGFKEEKALAAQENALIKEIRKELFCQPLCLIFYDRKAPRSYKSLFHNTYLVYDYVDKIKVFRNDKVFIELSP